MQEDDDTRRLQLRLLTAVQEAAEAETALDLDALGADVGRELEAVLRSLDRLQRLGLMALPEDPEVPPLLLDAGAQYLGRDGQVDLQALGFLATAIDDLWAREALLDGGTALVEEFRAAILRGKTVEHARGIVPGAFEPAVDERLALDLYAACVALMARLSEGAPAGCVGEEVVATRLLFEARIALELMESDGRVEAGERQVAEEALYGLFDLFQDDDVLGMFLMSEPSDAAVARLDPRNVELDVADQRVEAWFEPFAWAAPTGYLS